MEHKQLRFKYNPSAVGNMLSQLDMVKGCTSRENAQTYTPVYSNQIKPTLEITNQKSSGRCWMFAGLNIMRIQVIRKYNLGNDFNLSQSYLFFWDKMERTNYFMDNINKTRHLPLNDRLIAHLLTDPYCDGGQWDMFTNLVEKYGVIPQCYYQESYHSGNSRRLNWLLTCQARQVAQKIRDTSEDKFSEIKKITLEKTYHILCSMMGEPPVNFTWEYRNKKDEFNQHDIMTPVAFYKNCVDFNATENVCLVHDPRNEFNKTYTVKYLGNVAEGKEVRYINVPLHVLKETAINMIKENIPVWFGCDVGKWCSRDKCSMDMQLIDFSNTFGIEFTQSKADRLRYGESLMTHAMVFTGVHLSDNKPVRWKVENSWGSHGPNKGYYNMSDEWFDEYNYELVVPINFLNESLQEIYNKSTAIILDPWDPLGALA